MTAQERKYMAKSEPEQSDKNDKDKTHELSSEVQRLKSALKQMERNRDEVASKLDAKEKEYEALLKIHAKAERTIKKQGDALVTENYGSSKFYLLIKARTILSMSGPAETPECYRPLGQTKEEADELWHKVVCDWFDDYEKEMRGLACINEGDK